MRIELPEGYVPPEPTHPHYGYLTPQERAELEAAEREQSGQVGTVPGVDPEAGRPEAQVEAQVAARGPEARPQVVVSPPTALPTALPTAPLAVPDPPVTAPERETRRRPTGWVPQPPSPPRPPSTPLSTPPSTPPGAPAPPETGPAAGPAAGPVPAGPETRWDDSRQEGVAAEETGPPPDVAAAAGGRGSSSSWTSADGQRFRWDARSQEWVTERAEG